MLPGLLPKVCGWGPARTLWGQYALPPSLACIQQTTTLQVTQHQQNTRLRTPCLARMSGSQTFKGTAKTSQNRYLASSQWYTVLHTFTASSSHQDLQVPGGIGACK
jgi:hypothetical protein